MSYELRIGLLAAVCIVVTVWGYKFMKGKNVFSSSNYYYAEYEQIDELATTSPVLIRGLRVGTVSEVKLSDDMQRIIATLDIDKGIDIPKGTEALVVNTSIMGGKAVVLNVKGSCRGDECAKKGDVLPGRVQGMFESMFGTDDVQEMKTGLGDLISDLSDSLTGPDANNEFAKTFKALQHSLINMEGITSKVNESMSTYDRKMIAVLTNLEKITGTLAAQNGKIISTIDNLDRITSDLDEADIGKVTAETMTSAKEAIEDLDGAIASADKSFKELEKIMAEINSSQGTLGMLIHDKTLYNRFSESSRQLNLLLQDFRLNPKRYVNVSVFGKKQKEYDIPEDDPAAKKD